MRMDYYLFVKDRRSLEWSLVASAALKERLETLIRAMVERRSYTYSTNDFRIMTAQEVVEEFGLNWRERYRTSCIQKADQLIPIPVMK